MGKSIEDIYAELNEIFRDVFDDDDISVTPETTAADVDGWDSLNHIRLILTVSRKFGISFSAAEIASFKNVGELADAIKRRLG